MAACWRAASGAAGSAAGSADGSAMSAAAGYQQRADVAAAAGDYAAAARLRDLAQWERRRRIARARKNRGRR